MQLKLLSLFLALNLVTPYSQATFEDHQHDLKSPTVPTMDQIQELISAVQNIEHVAQNVTTAVNVVAPEVENAANAVENATVTIDNAVAPIIPQVQSLSDFISQNKTKVAIVTTAAVVAVCLLIKQGQLGK